MQVLNLTHVFELIVNCFDSQVTPTCNVKKINTFLLIQFDQFEVK